MWEKFQSLAPVLIGVFLGIYIQLLPGWASVGWTFAALLAGFLAMAIATALLARWPRCAAVLMQLGFLAPITLIALTTCATTWLSLHFAEWMGLKQHIPDPKQMETVTGVLLGAVNAFIAGAWLDDARKPGSRVWPAGQAKAAFSAAFTDPLKQWRASLPPVEGAAATIARRNEVTRVIEAVYETRVSGGGPEGWDLSALLDRIALIREALAPGRT